MGTGRFQLVSSTVSWCCSLLLPRQFVCVPMGLKDAIFPVAVMKAYGVQWYRSTHSCPRSYMAPTDLEAWWVPVPVWSFLRREKISCSQREFNKLSRPILMTGQNGHTEFANCSRRNMFSLIIAAVLMATTDAQTRWQHNVQVSDNGKNVTVRV